MNGPWKADAAAIALAERALEVALRDHAAHPDETTLARVLGSIGRLVVLDASSPVAGSRPTASRREVITVLNRPSIGDLIEDTAVRVRGVLVDDDGVPCEGGKVAACAALLETRDLLEHELLGAAFLLGCAPEELDPSVAARVLFDEIVQPESWRLVAFNEVRQAALSKIAPAVRARFWWWQLGAGMNPAAVDALSAAAALVAKFPRARVRFESLVRAQAIWDRSPKVEEPRVQSLRSWLSRRSYSTERSGMGTHITAETGLPLAAAGEDELLLVETSDLEISFEAPAKLIVDLLSERRPEARPTLSTPSGITLASTAVPNAYERFAFELPDSVLGESRLSITVAFVTGDVEIVLPPVAG